MEDCVEARRTQMTIDRWSQENRSLSDRLLEQHSGATVILMQARGDSIVEKVNSVDVQLGMTPHYLDLQCHEALYEVDLGVNEVRNRPDAH